MKKGEATKERIKIASLGLFHRQGYKSTSINHVLDSSGVKKGTFYFHYPSKEKLALDALHKALTEYDEKIKACAVSETQSDKILDMIEAIVSYHIENGTVKGCLFGNMALEMGNNGTGVSKFVKAVFEKWQLRYERMIEQAVENGELELRESAKAFSRIIIGLIQGGLVLSKISGDSGALVDCKQAVFALINERKTA